MIEVYLSRTSDSDNHWSQSTSITCTTFYLRWSYHKSCRSNSADDSGTPPPQYSNYQMSQCKRTWYFQWYWSLQIEQLHSSLQPFLLKQFRIWGWFHKSYIHSILPSGNGSGIFWTIILTPQLARINSAVVDISYYYMPCLQIFKLHIVLTTLNIFSNFIWYVSVVPFARNL